MLRKYKDHPDSERIIAREMGWTRLEEALDQQEQQKEHEQQQENKTENPEDNSGEFEEDIEDYGLPPPDPMRDERGSISYPINKRANDALHLLLDELKAAEHFPEEKDDQLADFVSGFMTVSAKLAGALGGIARGDDLFEPGMVIAWLKRILEILNQTIAAAEAIKGQTISCGRAVYVLSRRAFCDPRKDYGINHAVASAVTNKWRMRPACDAAVTRPKGV